MDKILKSRNLTGWLLAAPLVVVPVVFLVIAVIMIVIVIASVRQTTEFSIVPAFDLGNHEFPFGSPDTYAMFLSTFKYAVLIRIGGGGRMTRSIITASVQMGTIAKPETRPDTVARPLDMMHEAIRRWKQACTRVWGDPLIQHLLLDDSKYATPLGPMPPSAC